jgi:hypothetical protein
MERMSKRNSHPWLARFAQVTALGTVLAICMTWVFAAVDHPVDYAIDTAITAGMASPACAEVRAMAAGSLLSASPQPPHANYY